MVKETKAVSLSDPGAFDKPILELKTESDLDAYRLLHERSIRNPEGFWSGMADRLDWYKKWEKVLEYDFHKPEIHWFKGGKLNASYNCLDRHLGTWRSSKVALIWQGEFPEENRCFTYQQLHYHVCKFANVLKKFGVKKGDRVSLYLPMIPELPIAMLACARIGAIHSAVPIAFGYQALGDRIRDSGSKLLITADGHYRGGKIVQDKTVADEALKACPGVEKVIVVKRLRMDCAFAGDKDSWWHEEMGKQDISVNCEPEVMDAEDTFFLLYTSGSTGKPWGVIHTIGGYLLFACQTLKWLFAVKDLDVFFCTEDISGLTGHSCVVYGPLALGATTLMFEGIPTYPSPDRFWEIIERFKVTIFCTGPEVIRTLMQEGEEWVRKRETSSLRILGSVGEPIHPDEWKWYHTRVGQKRCPIVETRLQTEVGGFLTCRLPINGEATFPLPGLLPKILRENGTECDVDEVGFLVLENAWPAMLRGFWNDSDMKGFREACFKLFPGHFFTGEGAKRDMEGYFHLMGKIDNMIHVSGNRIGMAEMENALASHPSVAETAVMGISHHEKGTKIYALVKLKPGVEENENLKEELLTHAKKLVGASAPLDKLQFAKALPKMRNGITIKRLLPRIMAEEVEELGDTCTGVAASEEWGNFSTKKEDSLLIWKKRGSKEEISGGEFPELNIKEPFFYHPGHTWVKVEKVDQVRIGIDPFLGKVIGKAKGIVLPLSEARCLRGENLCSIVQEEGIFHMVFPVSGCILSANQKLKDRPELIAEDPWGEGFLLTLRPDHFHQDQKHLFFGEKALSWYQREIERFTAAAVSEFDGHERIGVTMQDGGINIRDIKALVGPKRYTQLVSTFLRNGEKGSLSSK